MRRRKSVHRSARSKETRELVSAIERAGGCVVITARGHLKVTGPAGLAIVGSAKPTGQRCRANMLAALRRHAGLDVALS
jgi:hypothetical protein